MAKIMVAGTEKVALSGTGTGPFTKAQAEVKAKKMNEKAEKLGVETRYEAKA